MDSRAHIALRALAAQLGAAAIVVGIVLASQAGHLATPFGVWEIAGMQGMLSAVLGIVLGLAWWWFPINLIFLPAVMFVQQIQLPAMAYLGGFLLLLLFNWGVIFTRVPLYLSRKSVWREVEALLPQDESYRLLDIGSGLGGMLLQLDQTRPLGRHEGVEISPAPWLVSWIRAYMRGASARFLRRDYRQLDLSHYDVVFAFLSPLVMQDVLHKASQEMRPGTLLLSLAFPLPGVSHDFVIQTGTSERQKLYGWHVRPDFDIGYQDHPSIIHASPVH
jgi:hypothetical protein